MFSKKSPALAAPCPITLTPVRRPNFPNTNPRSIQCEERLLPSRGWCLLPSPALWHQTPRRVTHPQRRTPATNIKTKPVVQRTKPANGAQRRIGAIGQTRPTNEGKAQRSAWLPPWVREPARRTSSSLRAAQRRPASRRRRQLQRCRSRPLRASCFPRYSVPQCASEGWLRARERALASQGKCATGLRAPRRRRVE
jgi:hypothetical protein